MAVRHEPTQTTAYMFTLDLFVLHFAWDKLMLSKQKLDSKEQFAAHKNGSVLRMKEAEG